MPTEAVWIIVTIPRKEHEKEIKNLKKQNNNNNWNISDEKTNSIKNSNETEISIEKNLEEALELLGIEDVVWIPSKNRNFFQVYFPCDLSENDSTLQYLQSKGIGTKPLTSIGYIPFGLFYYDEFQESDEESSDGYRYSMPGEMDECKFSMHKKKGFKEVTNNFLKSVTSRLTVAQVVDGIRSGSELTFDFYCYTFFAGFIAAMGLVNNDPIAVTAAMMIEPIMGTVMAITFGAVIEDKNLFMTGIKSCVASLLFCIVEGYIVGMIFFIWKAEWNPPPNGFWPTNEMASRGTYRSLIYGVLVALPSGGAIAVTLLNNNQAALVGVAVASTFLPPFINTGLLWALSTNLQIRGLYEDMVPINMSGTTIYMKNSWVPQTGYSVIYSYDMRIENALLGCVSMALTGVNIISMLLFAYILLKIKEVIPLGKLAPGTQRFFKQDIKLARNYNRKSMALGNTDSLGQQILKEWAEISGLDKDELLNDKPEAKVTQLQTLFDIAQDVEADESYKSILRNAYGIPDQSKSQLVRRLTQPALYGNRRRSSAANSTQTGIPNVWNTNGDLNNRINGRRYTLNPLSNKLSNNESKSRTGSLTDGSDISQLGRGLKPNEMEGRNRRGSTAQLRKSLKSTVHSPYSVWPSHVNRARSPSSDLNIRRRTSLNPILEINRESTGF